MVHIWRHLPQEITCYLSKRNHEAITALWRPELFFYKEIYVFFEFLGALPVCFWTFLGAKSVRGVMCTHKPSLKCISKAKTSIFTFLWLTSGFGIISFLGPETRNTVDLKKFLEKTHLIYI